VLATAGLLGATSEGHYCEGAARLQLGSGFFRADSRPARDLGVLLARQLAAQGPLRVLDAMAGCGIRALRYGLEAGASAVWANDADPDRLPLLQANLAELAGARCAVTTSSATAQQLLAGCLQRQERFELVDLDAFGCPTALLPLALEAVALGGVLYLASTDGRSATGHDRRAALRSLGAAARAHPAAWELALRLQLGSVARAAWAMGRGIAPLLAFSEGRTFRIAVRLQRLPAPREEEQLGLLALCHGCGDQQLQPLLRLRQWQPCACPAGEAPPLAVSGPLWLGPLQDLQLLAAMAADAAAADAAASTGQAAHVGRPARALLERLGRDLGTPARCWPTAEIARRLGCGPPPLQGLVAALEARGWASGASGVMPGCLRSLAPWPVILAETAALAAARSAALAAAK
jgi:tRNA (guanine26-N2/guanine27-N2)-dimethyltransferase